MGICALGLLGLDKTVNVLAHFGGALSGWPLPFSLHPDTLLRLKTNVAFWIIEAALCVLVIANGVLYGRARRQVAAAEVLRKSLYFMVVLATPASVFALNSWAERRDAADQLWFSTSAWHFLSYAPAPPVMTLLVPVQVLASIVVALAALLTSNHQRLQIPALLALALVSGGALANLFDRLVFVRPEDMAPDGLVHFPIVNLSQVLIALGALILLLSWVWLQLLSEGSEMQPLGA